MPRPAPVSSRASRSSRSSPSAAHGRTARTVDATGSVVGPVNGPQKPQRHRLTHVDARGAVTMVDVSPKTPTVRHAVARALLRCRPSTRDALWGGQGHKGEAIAVAKVAGIMGAKKTSELIPLCHPLGLDDVAVAIEVVAEGLQITATARCTGKTGVEMEAMMAATIAGLALYDMGKAAEREMVLSEVELLEKGGGKSGLWRRADRATVRPRPKR